MTKVNVVYVVFSALFVLSQSKELPKYLMDLRCAVDKDYDACFVKNGNLAIPLVARGDPDYNIPKMNPLEMDFISLISTPNLNLNLTHIMIYGLENLQIMNNTKFQWEKGIWTITLKSENLTLHGQYEVDGKIMIMPIKGTGNISIYLKNGAFKVTATTANFEKDGDTYVKPLGLRIDYHFDKIEFNFDNLFEGNKQLGQEVNKFLNDNWDLLLVDFGPGIADTISSIISRIFGNFAKVVPRKNMFLQ